MPEYESQRRWRKENRVRVTFCVMKRTEADILERLENVASKATYIKALIREDIEKGKGK